MRNIRYNYIGGEGSDRYHRLPLSNSSNSASSFANVSASELGETVDFLVDWTTLGTAVREMEEGDEGVCWLVMRFSSSAISSAMVAVGVELELEDVSPFEDDKGDLDPPTEGLLACEGEKPAESLDPALSIASASNVALW